MTSLTINKLYLNVAAKKKKEKVYEWVVHCSTRRSTRCTVNNSLVGGWTPSLWSSTQAEAGSNWRAATKGKNFFIIVLRVWQNHRLTSLWVFTLHTCRGLWHSHPSQRCFQPPPCSADDSWAAAAAGGPPDSCPCPPPCPHQHGAQISTTGCDRFNTYYIYYNQVRK